MAMNDSRIARVEVTCPHCGAVDNSQEMKMKGGAEGNWEGASLFARNKRQGIAGTMTSSLMKKGVTICLECQKPYAWRYHVEPVVVCTTGKIEWESDNE